MSAIPGDDGDASPGWFGKLACLGDFASRRLPAEFVAACDGWLSRGVEKSRAQLGDIWLDTYLTSPLWRFAWAPGLIDGQWWVGVMMPSVDKVGRYFPLVVAVSRADAPLDGHDLDELERWFASVAEAMLGTLRDDASLERFESDLHDAPRLAEPPAAAVPAEETHWTNRTGYRFAAGRSLGDSFHDLLRHDALQRYGGRSLWWLARGPGDDNQLTVADGLPLPESFVDLLQGVW